MEGFETILENIKNEKYINKKTRPVKPKEANENYIINEEKSVRWNREQREKAIETYSKELEEYRKYGRELYKQFKQEVINAIMKATNLNEKQANSIYEYSARESEPYGELVLKITEIVELLLKLKEEK